MAHINLLPWREGVLKQKQKEYFTLLTAIALIACAVILIVNLYYQAANDRQNERNQFLKSKIAVLDSQIKEIRTLDDKKDALQERMNVIEQLQFSRNVGTQILDEMAKIISSGIYITQLEKQDNVMYLTGKSESNNHLANMIRAIELSDLFIDATPESITTDDDSPKLLSSFKMKVTIKRLTVNPSLSSKKGA
jgi:type IV pilus assembly protein PilN